MLLSACANGAKLTQRVTIQSSELKLSNERLTESVRIIKLRLNSFDTDDFEIKSIPLENKITVSFSEEWKIDDISPLLTEKGELEFCTTIERNEVERLVDKNTDLFSMLNPDTLFSQIGSAREKKMHEIRKIINSLQDEHKFKFVWSLNPNDTLYHLYAINPTTIITGQDIENASWNKVEGSDDNFYISIQLKQSAISSWSNATRDNIGKPIAIVLDNKMLAVPIVRTEIVNGKCQITGNFSETEAKRFALLMTTELPCSFKIIK